MADRHSHMKYILFRRRPTRHGHEILVGRSLVWLVWVVLAFILILLGHTVVGLRWP